MNTSIERLCTYEKLLLWEEHPCFKEYEKIREEECVNSKARNFDKELAKKHSQWTPITLKNRDFVKLRNKFHPAIIREEGLCKINQIGMDLFKTSIFLSPKSEEKLLPSKPIFVDRFITFHAGAPFSFQPTIFEVLNELPEDLCKIEGKFFYNVEKLEDCVGCIIGIGHRYNVGLTTVYRLKQT